MASERKMRARARALHDPLDPACQHKAMGAGVLVSGYVNGKMLAGTSATSRAFLAWRRVAGRRALKHTVSVFLKTDVAPRGVRAGRGSGEASPASYGRPDLVGAAAPRAYGAAVGSADPASPLPELYVYLDGNALMADLSTNADLYRERLAYVGLPVSAVRFRLSRHAAEHRAALREESAAGARATVSPTASAAAPVRPLPELSLAEEARVREACASLPDGLRQKASEAMRSSLRWEKSKDTRDRKADA